jgi:uncharacterized membrane protein YebE (DUF533 family)
VIDAKRLLEQVLGPGIGNDLSGAGQQVRNRLDGMGGTQAFTGGALAGGVLGLLLGGGGGGGKMMRYGGAAALGAMALQAYQNYQQQQAGRPFGSPSAPTSPLAVPLPHATPAADGNPFELALVRAMIGAAKADGRIDATEQRRLFAEVERLGLDAEAKAFVFDLLTQDIDVVSAVSTEEQAAELYLAARLAIDLDEPAEREFLDELATALKLPPGLRTRLDAAPSNEGSSKPQA